MKNVIAFPEEKMKRAQKHQKKEAKNAMLSLSIVSFIMGALLLNETFSHSVRPVYIVSDNSDGSQIETLNRAIASAQPMNPFRDLEWEKSMVKKLGKDISPEETRTPASLGRSVSSIDQLRFGPLAGKYHLLDQSSAKNPKIKEIEYVESSEANDRPVFLNPDLFLKDYGPLLSVNFELYDKANPHQNNVREYRLLDSQKKVVGTAAFVMDDEGRFLSLKVREAAVN